MKDITVLLLDQTFSSTAIGPMEVFRHAGSLWNILTGTRPDPPFRVTTASADGRAVNCDGGIQIQPNVALKDIRKTDLIFVPTTGLRHRRCGRAQCAGCALVEAHAQTRRGDCQRVFGRGPGGRCRLARRQTRYYALGIGGAVSREVSQGEVDAGM